MANNERRSPIPLIIAGVVAAAVAIWVGILAFGSDEAPTTTSAPATTEVPTTTMAPTTTDQPTTTSSPTTTAAPTTTSAPATTTPEAAGPELVEGEVEEGLVRTFPVAGGWIVETDDESLTVGLSVGAQDCYGLASAEMEETSDRLSVTMTAGFRSEATGCAEVAGHWTYTFPLESPRGDRAVVDTHTGEELGTEPPDPEE